VCFENLNLTFEFHVKFKIEIGIGIGIEKRNHITVPGTDFAPNSDFGGDFLDI